MNFQSFFRKAVNVRIRIVGVIWTSGGAWMVLSAFAARSDRVILICAGGFVLLAGIGLLLVKPIDWKAVDQRMGIQRDD